MGTPQDIYLLILDSLRADRAPPANTTHMPNLSDLVSNSFIFSNAYSTSSWSLPAHASLFTGKYPSEHHATARQKQLSHNDDILAKNLSENGYQTTCVTTNPWLTPEFNLTQGFNVVQNLNDDLPFQNTPDPRDDFDADSSRERLKQAFSWCLNGNPVKRTLKGLYLKFAHEHSHPEAADVVSVLEDKAGRSSGPRFWFANFMDTHEPYFSDDCHDRVNWNLHSVGQEQELPAEAIINEYDDSVRYLDQQLGRLFSTFREKGVLNSSWIIILSDHGQSLGEDNYWGHGTFLLDSLIEVPVYICPPGGLKTSKTLESPFSIRKIYDIVTYLSGYASLSTSDVQGLLNNATEKIVASESAGPSTEADYPVSKISKSGYRRYISSEWQLLEEIKENSTELISTSQDISNAEIEQMIKKFKERHNMGDNWEGGEANDVSKRVENRLVELGYR